MGITTWVVTSWIRPGSNTHLSGVLSLVRNVVRSIYKSRHHCCRSGRVAAEGVGTVGYAGSPWHAALKD